jgi:hypothetical protein
MTWSRATAIAGSAVVTLACCRIRIVRGHREPPPRPETRLDATARLCQAERHETNRTGLARAADEVRTCHQPEDRQIHRAHNTTDAHSPRRRGDRIGGCPIGPKQTWALASHMSAFGVKRGLLHCTCPLMTQSGHRHLYDAGVVTNEQALFYMKLIWAPRERCEAKITTPCFFSTLAI